jgi:hypothetical protein
MTAPNDNESYDPSAEPEQDDVEDDGVLDASDTLEGDPGDDPLDAGIITADRWSAGEGFGTTEAEEREGESLDQLLAEEEPEPDPYAEAADAEDDPLDDGPDPRAGRLLSADEGAHSDQEPDLVANDVGIDGGAATAEEAAVHVLADDEDG